MSRTAKWVVGIAFGLIAVFCLSFIFFYSRAQRQQPQPSPNTQAETGKHQKASQKTKPASQPSDPDAQEQTRQQLLTRVGYVLRASAESAMQWKDEVAAANVQAQV